MKDSLFGDVIFTCTRVQGPHGVLIDLTRHEEEENRG